MTFFASWDGDDNYLQIRIAAQFIRTVARETLAMNPDRLELQPEFRLRDHQMEAIAITV
jgi:AraC family transcriptional regulator